MTDSRSASNASAAVKFSLVVSTVGRADCLGELLESLERQTLRDFEVIVVDQSRGPAIGEVVCRYMERFSVRHVPMEERGASRGRNRGIAAARGEWLAFPDDDCTYPPSLLEDACGVIDSDPELAGISLPTAAPLGTRNVSRFDRSEGPITKANVLGRMVEAGLFVRAEALGDLRFNESLGVGAGTPWGADEGPDLVLRLLERGARIRYCPGLAVLHPSPETVVDRRVLDRSYSYSCGRGRLYRLHGYPWRTVAWSLVRSLAGSGLWAVRLRPDRAKYYWLAFRGKLRGYFG